jgi:predicted NAD-dependent protein-ADP-ribosyltransferase YbiA (DUF1768 family)
MSTVSPHGFVIDAVRWPTVEHYLIAKKFEGTELESKIRGAKTVAAAKFLARPRQCVVDLDGRPVKTIRYGSDEAWSARSDWTDVREHHLEKAFLAKFDQNPSIKKKLLETEGMSLVDSMDETGPSVASILEKIRNSYAEKARSPVIRKSIMVFRGRTDVPLWGSDPNWHFEVESKRISDAEIVDVVMRVASQIKDLEGVDKYYVEMFEDAVYNILNVSPTFVGETLVGETLVGETFVEAASAEGRPKPSTEDGLRSAVEDVITELHKWMEEAFSEWSRTINSMPRFENLVKLAERKLASAALVGFGASENVRTAIWIATFIRWCRYEDGINYDITSQQVVLPPKERRYRIEVVSELPISDSAASSSKKHRGAAHRSEANLEDPRSEGGEEDVQSSGPLPPTVVCKLSFATITFGTRITIKGEITTKMRSQFLALGGSEARGRLTSTGARKEGEPKRKAKLVLPLQAVSELPKILYPRIKRTPEDLYQLWRADKLRILKGVEDQVGYVLPKLTSEERALVARTILGRSTNDPLPDRLQIELPSEGLLANADVLNSKNGWGDPHATTFEKAFQNVEAVLMANVNRSSVKLIRAAAKIVSIPVGRQNDISEYVSTVCSSSSVKKIKTDEAAKKHLSEYGITSDFSGDQYLHKPLAACMAMAAVIHYAETVGINYHELYIFDPLGEGSPPETAPEEVHLSLREGSEEPNRDPPPPADDLQTPKRNEKSKPRLDPSDRPASRSVPPITVAAIKNGERGSGTDLGERGRGSTKETPGVYDDASSFLELSSDVWILVVANATSISLPRRSGATKSELATREIYEMYPYANVYSNPDREGAYQPGDVMVLKGTDAQTDAQTSGPSPPTVVSLFAEYASGGPKKTTDTKDARAKWFSKALGKLKTFLPGPTTTLAIACGAVSAGYREMLQEFAVSTSSIIKIIDPSGGGPTSAPNKKHLPSLSSTAERGVFYDATFASLYNTPSEYTKLVDYLEKCSTPLRAAWLEKFINSEMATQTEMLKEVQDV